MNTFANGVAVYPTYDALGKLLYKSLIKALIADGSPSSFFVLTEALSASSSIIKI